MMEINGKEDEYESVGNCGILQTSIGMTLRKEKNKQITSERAETLFAKWKSDHTKPHGAMYE